MRFTAWKSTQPFLPLVFPTRRHIAGFWIKAIFAGEGQKAREETDQAAIVFGDGGGQVVIGNFGNRLAIWKPVRGRANRANSCATGLITPRARRELRTECGGMGGRSGARLNRCLQHAHESGEGLGAAL